MHPQQDKIKSRLDAMLADLTKHQAVKQALIAVESGDRSFQWTGAIGETVTGERIIADTPFFIASIDKLYNATITMLLNETSQIDIHKPISSYLPEAMTRQLHTARGQDLSNQILVRHLLTHTSGLPDWLEDYPAGGRSLVESIIEDGDRILIFEEQVAYVRDHLKPHFPPQDLSTRHPKVRYSDTNFILIMAIIESVTGQPLHKVHEELLYKPLGLRQTYFPGVTDPLVKTSPQMTLLSGGIPLSIPKMIQSVKGIYSTAADMIEFLRKLMSDKVFSNAETLNTMISSFHPFGFPTDRASLRAPGWPIEYGMGIMRFQLPRIFTPISRMPAVLGHTGSTGCWLFYCPELDLYLAGSVEEVTAGAVPFRIVPKILSYFEHTR